MLIQKYKIVFPLILLYVQIAKTDIIVQGIVTNNGAEPVHNAKVELLDIANPSMTYQALTNEQGQYSLRVEDERTNQANSTGLQNQSSSQYILRIIGENIETYEQRNLAIANNIILNAQVISTVTDIDGNVYRTIKIGDQWWVAENLKVKHYRYGDAIAYLKDNTTWGPWSSLKIGACCNYDHNEANADVYGLLYNWYAANDLRSIAPEGWHVPTNADWKKLEMYLGMSQSEVERGLWRGKDEGGKLKETGTAHWKSPNTGATDEFGFSAVPGGARFNNDFYGMSSYAFFWTSTGNPGYYATYRSLYFRYSDIFSYSVSVDHGFSVRCVKD